MGGSFGNQTYLQGSAPQESLIVLDTSLGQIFPDYPLFVPNSPFRCSLLEEDELPLESLQPPPLPDILTTEEEILEPPHITIEEAGEEEGGLTPLPACEPIVASPQPPFTPLPRDYTVEEGFERPEGGWEEDGVEVRSVQGNCDSDIEEDGGEGDPKSSSSSSLPSESSGIFYRAEYTPHPSHQPSPAPGLLSVENRDSYWAALLSRQQTRPAVPLRKVPVILS